MRIRLLSAALLATNLAAAATPINGWYSSVFGGYTYLPDNIYNLDNNVFRNNVGYSSGYNVGGRIGYQSNPIRYELEYTYLNANAEDFNLDYIPQTGVTGYSSTNLIMANIYYDFHDILPAISPFLGFGIGYAHLQTALNSIGPDDISNFKVSENAFAYQGTAGLTYNFAENYALNIAYRYVITAEKGNFGRVYQADIGSVGAVFRFDGANYK